MKHRFVLALALTLLFACPQFLHADSPLHAQVLVFLPAYEGSKLYDPDLAAKGAGFVTKSGLMLGIGEEENEIAATLRDMAADKLDILTLGQYLRPSAQHLPLYRWVTPEEFARWKQFGLDLGFRVVESGPLVRSSYHADEQSDALVPGSRPPRDS